MPGLDLRRSWLPPCGLLLALSTVFLFAGERDHFYSYNLHDSNTAKNMALAKNLSARRGFLFLNMRQRADGTVRYALYNRFPIGTFVLIKLAIAPFEGDFAAQLVAARMLMLAFFCAAAALAYLALARLVGSRVVALGATLLAFSSYHLLHYADAVSNEMSVDLFAVMLVFHGMVLFRGDGAPDARGEEGRFWQLVGKVCAALLLGWHVYGLLLPFLVLGAVREAAAAWRGSGAAPRKLVWRLRAAAGHVLRGRSVLLGALALLFGTGVLGYNLAREHAALGGKRAVAELPSVRSMLARTGLRETGASSSEDLAWPTFLKRQFHRVGATCVPFALSGGVEFDELAWQASAAPWLFYAGMAATLGCFAGLALFRRPRSPPAALALAGFGWAFLVPASTAWSAHQFETMFHVGVPLCLFAAVLLAARRVLRGRVATIGAAASLLIFAKSSVALGLRHLDDGAAQAQRQRMAEFDAIAKTIRGRSVWVATHRRVLDRFLKNSATIDFFTAGSFVHYPQTLDAGDPDFVGTLDFALAFERYSAPALLTPEHGSVFLYEAGAKAAAVLAARRDARRREYRRLNSLAPVARSGFDIHVVPGGATGRQAPELAYLKASCRADDTAGRFYLRVVPADADLPWGARLGFDRRDFFFLGHGVMVDGGCMMRVPLPEWAVANVVTGQFPPAGAEASWHAAFRLDVDRLRGVLRAARAEAPSARSAFDLYLAGALRGGVLRYVREPCAPEDVRRRFFLHVVPDAVSALPTARRPSGFANLDFEFGEHGALVDEACVAMLTLPDYNIARVRTGQFDADAGVAWQVELAADATATGR